jgi:type VI secretion system protein
MSGRRRRHPGGRAVLCLALAAPALAGCGSWLSTPSWLCVLPPGPRSITLVAAPDANHDSAVAVDLVFITDPVAARRVEALSAEDYFTQRAQLLRDFPDGITVRSWGLAPGQVARDQSTDADCNRVSTLLFARYATPGDHRQKIEGGPLTVSLGADDFTVEP